MTIWSHNLYLHFASTTFRLVTVHHHRDCLHCGLGIRSTGFMHQGRAAISQIDSNGPREALQPRAALRRRWHNMAPHWSGSQIFGTLWVPSSYVCRRWCSRWSSLLWPYVNERKIEIGLEREARHGKERECVWEGKRDDTSEGGEVGVVAGGGARGYTRKQCCILREELEEGDEREKGPLFLQLWLGHAGQSIPLIFFLIKTDEWNA